MKSQRFFEAMLCSAAVCMSALFASAVDAQCSLDLDGDGAVIPGVDGLLLSRASLGVAATALASDVAIGSTAQRKTGDAVRDFLVTQCGVNLATRAVANTTGCTPDIDGDDLITATVDGLILSRVRRMPDSAAILNGINFPANATRKTWTDIRNYLVTTCGVDLSALSGPNAVVAGALSSPFPTINHLSVLWAVSSDANRNSKVTVRFRKLGASDWKIAMPLRRVAPDTNEGFTWAYRHAGSLFGLDAGTTYEIEATLDDPDGGSETRTISATTRSVPAAMPGAPVKAATPSNIETVLNAAVAGDIIQLGSGTYGSFSVDRSGQPGKPIVVRGSAGTIVNGEIGIFLKSYIHIEGLTVNGRIRFNGSNNMSITRNTVNPTAQFSGDGIVTLLRAENAYIADNTVNGLTVWQESSLGVDGNNLGEGILVTGPGHVVEYNRVRGMRDGISFLEGTEALDQFSIDVLNNDISESGDDGIEADFCQHNCRIINNRLTNNFIALSSQPSLGGPTYFIGNAVYNVAHVAFKLYRGSVGDVIMHNTVVKNGDAFGIYAGRTVKNTYMRNNLLIGGPGATYNGFSSGIGRVIDADDIVTSTYDGNYDGFGSTLGTFTGNIGTLTFNSLASLRSTTTQRNAIQVGLNAFAAAIAFPTNAMTQFSVPDLRLAGGSVAIDAGIAIPNVNDGYLGSAPDLGAYEFGKTPPTYGPR
jgi:Right handed beta helix region